MVASSRSSGSGTPRDNVEGEGEVSKDRVGNWSMDDLSATWDNCPLVRERLRGGNQLLMNYDEKKHVATNSYVDKTTASLRLNHFVMSPVFKLMAKNEKTLPNIDRLLQQITVLFERSKL